MSSKPGMVIAFGILYGTGCAASFEEARLAGLKTAAPMAKASAERPADIENYCRKLDKNRRSWTACMAAFGVVGGTSGLAAIQSEYPLSTGARLGLAGGVVGSLAIAAWCKAEAEGAGEAWARDCR